MTRRGFAKLFSGGTAMLFFLGNTIACTGSVFTNILDYVGVGLSAFQGVLDILAPFIPSGGLLLTIIADVKTGFADLLVVVQQYEAAPAADKTTLVAKISLVLTEIVSNLQTFWSNLNIPNPVIAAVVEGVLSVLIGVLQGFIHALPPIPTPAIATAAHQLPKQLPQTPRKMSIGEFKRKVNEICQQNGQKPIFP